MASVERVAASPIVSPSPSTMVSGSGRALVVLDGDRLSSSRDEQIGQHWGAPPTILTQRQGHTQRATASSSAEARAAGQRQRHKHPGGRGEWSGIAEETGHRKLGTGLVAGKQVAARCGSLLQRRLPAYPCEYPLKFASGGTHTRMHLLGTSSTWTLLAPAYVCDTPIDVCIWRHPARMHRLRDWAGCTA